MNQDEIRLREGLTKPQGGDDVLFFMDKSDHMVMNIAWTFSALSLIAVISSNVHCERYCERYSS